MRNTVRYGFTLTELLVVGAILSLTMAILMPALRTSRQKVEAVACTSNIHQLGIAISIYTSDNRIVPPGFVNSMIEPPGGFPGDLAYDRVGWWWFNYIGPFYSNQTDRNTILKCPAKNLRESTLFDNILCGNYGVNSAICKITSIGKNYSEFVGRPLKISGIKDPSRTLLITDSGYALINWWHATLNPPLALNSMFIENTSYVPGMRINSQKAVWPGQEYDAINGRHPNRTVNVGFADGHIETKKADELLVEKREDKYDNRIPLWSPK